MHGFIKVPLVQPPIILLSMACRSWLLNIPLNTSLIKRGMLTHSLNSGELTHLNLHPVIKAPISPYIHKVRP